MFVVRIRRIPILKKKYFQNWPRALSIKALYLAVHFPKHGLSLRSKNIFAPLSQNEKYQKYQISIQFLNNVTLYSWVILSASGALRSPCQCSWHHSLRDQDRQFHSDWTETTQIDTNRNLCEDLTNIQMFQNDSQNCKDHLNYK